MRHLEVLLEKEFTALSARELERFEAMQPERIRLLQTLSDFVGALPTDDPLREQAPWREFQALAKQCRELHRRNEILLQRQLEQVRKALDALHEGTTDSVETYDRLGQLARRGYRNRWIDEA